MDSGKLHIAAGGTGIIETDPRDKIILSLCEKLYICSRMLTCAAEKLSWDNTAVQELVQQLKDKVREEAHASLQS